MQCLNFHFSCLFQVFGNLFFTTQRVAQYLEMQFRGKLITTIEKTFFPYLTTTKKKLRHKTTMKCNSWLQSQYICIDCIRLYSLLCLQWHKISYSKHFLEAWLFHVMCSKYFSSKFLWNSCTFISIITCVSPNCKSMIIIKSRLSLYDYDNTTDNKNKKSTNNINNV